MQDGFRLDRWRLGDYSPALRSSPACVQDAMLPVSASDAGARPAGAPASRTRGVPSEAKLAITMAGLGHAPAQYSSAETVRLR
jgi:hypothetical protein